MEAISKHTLLFYRFNCNCREHFFLHNISFYSFILLLVTWGIPSVGADDSGVGGSNLGIEGIGTLQTSNQVFEYLNTLKQSQDEIFRKIDRLTKVVEEKDHEDYQFRLKFTRKVHTLESKVIYMEHTFTRKVEQVVQKKVDELMSAVDNRLRHNYNYHPVSGSSSSSNSRNSHGSGDNNNRIVNIQNYQPVASYNSIHPPYHRYQSHYQLSHIHNPSPYNYYNQNRNWGFYEHPITHKRVRDSQGNLFGYEPPTRDLPLISLVATTTSAASSQQNSRSVSDGVKGGPTSTSRNTAIRVEEEGTTGEMDVPPKFIEEAKKKFESYDKTLHSLRENVTNMEKELFRTMGYQNKENDNSEMHLLLVDTKKEITSLHQKHQEMIHRIEHFTVEIEKAAAKREHSVNESLREMSFDLRKQISAVKAFAKKQVQNISSTPIGNSQTSDKLRCAQTLLDELLAQIGKGKTHPSQMIRYNSIADQAGSEEEQNGNERALFYMSRRSADKQGTTDRLIKELATQRKDIMDLKSEIGKLNISQILLMRIVDQETLKRTVRPRDCAEIRLLKNATSGIYSIFPHMNDVSTQVYCDMQNDGGGWTVIQRRGTPIPPDSIDGRRESFARNWDEYEQGFGSLQGDFWLGLSSIALLCKLGVQELRIDLLNWSGETRFATYQYFKISNSSQLYRLNVKGYSGTAGDSLTRHNGMAFSTPDQDNDTDPRRHCAKTYYSGWWFYACFESNLNGLYIGDGTNNSTHHAFGTGIIWHHWLNNDYSLKGVEMKIRNKFL